MCYVPQLLHWVTLEFQKFSNRWQHCLTNYSADGKIQSATIYWAVQKTTALAAICTRTFFCFELTESNGQTNANIFSSQNFQNKKFLFLFYFLNAIGSTFQMHTEKSVQRLNKIIEDGRREDRPHTSRFYRLRNNYFRPRCSFYSS